MLDPKWPAAMNLSRFAEVPTSIPTAVGALEDTPRPFVSIIISSHNYGAYVDDAIGSALDQTYPDLEVIVVDDGSRDDSPERIRAWGDRIIAIFQPNGGQASAWNTGFSRARGDVVMFLDADDRLLPEAAELAVRALTPGVVKVHFPLRVIDRKGVPQPALNPPFELAEGDVRGDLLTYGYYSSPPTSGNAFTRAALEAVFPIPEVSFRMGADNYVISMTGMLGRIGRVNQVCGQYRIHGANHSPAGGMSLDRMRGEMQREIARSELLENIALAQGLKARRRLHMHLPSHVRNRLYSRAIDPAGHPWPEDTRWGLALRGVRAVWSSPGQSLNRKLTAGLGFLLMSALPRPIMQRFGPWMIEPHKRPTWLRRLLR